MIKKITFHSCSSTDYPFLLDLFASSREREFQHVKWSVENRCNFLKQQFNAQQTHYATHFPKREHQIIYVDKKRVGMQDVCIGESEVRLLDIILLPENRNAGLGTQLLEKIITEADRLSYPTRLYVEKFNPAERLYERMGFTIKKDTGVHYYMERLPKI